MNEDKLEKRNNNIIVVLTFSLSWIPAKFVANRFIKLDTEGLKARVTIRVLENCPHTTHVRNQVIPYCVICLVAECFDHFEDIRA